MPIPPYSAVRGNDTIAFISGQLPLDETGRIPEDIESQTRVALTNLEQALHTAGMTADDVVKTTLFVTDITQLPTVNKAYVEFFSTPYPARSAVQVTALAQGAGIEIEAVALRAH